MQTLFGPRMIVLITGGISLLCNLCVYYSSTVSSVLKVSHILTCTYNHVCNNRKLIQTDCSSEVSNLQPSSQEADTVNIDHRCSSCQMEERAVTKLVELVDQAKLLYVKHNTYG